MAEGISEQIKANVIKIHKEATDGQKHADACSALNKQQRPLVPQERQFSDVMSLLRGLVEGTGDQSLEDLNTKRHEHAKKLETNTKNMDSLTVATGLPDSQNAYAMEITREAHDNGLPDTAHTYVETVEADDASIAVIKGNARLALTALSQIIASSDELRGRLLEGKDLGIAGSTGAVANAALEYQRNL
jgi:hypothetical protein